MIPVHKLGERLICPVCKSPFKFGPEHKFVRADAFVCSWKCFLKRDDPPPANLDETPFGPSGERLILDELDLEPKPEPVKKKRGRPRKQKEE